MVKLDLKEIYEWPLTLQLFVVLPLCAIIFYLAYFFDFSSLNKTLLDKQNQQKDLSQQIEMIFNQQIKLENELTQFAVDNLIINEWRAKLVAATQLPDLLNDILKIGTAKGLKFDSLQPGVEVKDDIYMKTPIKIVAQGGYHQFANFISETANLPMLVVIRNVDLTKPKIQDNKGKNLAEQAALKNILMVEMILEVYNQKLAGNQTNEKK